MDVLVLLFLSLISILFGAILTLVLQYYVLLVYFKKNPKVDPPSKQTKTDLYALPEAIKSQLENENYSSDKTGNSSLSISLLLQFLFHELRHSDGVKRWLFKKLSLEFDELLTKTTIGKFFDSVTIRDMNLGSQFPDIKSISTESVKLDKKEGHIETLNLCLNLDYSGNFLLSVDAKMKFGKTAYLSIRVKKLSGCARLQFTRQPYTHWSFSFYNEPVMELAVESHFQGRQLQSNITNLIVNQIKKAIKRKHTLPNYKIRYRPFFVKADPGQLDLDDSEIVAQGQLEVTCIEITRLSTPQGVQNIYCTIAADSVPWISLYQKNNEIYMVLELTVTRLRQAQLGVIFKQEQGSVVIDSLSPHGAGARCGLKIGDVVLAIESKNINSVQQISKLVKSLSNSSITFRVERVVDNYVIKEKDSDKKESKTQSLPPEETIEDTDVSQAEQDNFVIIDKPKTTNDSAESKRTKSIPTLDKFKTPEKVPKLITGSDNVSKIAQTIGSFSLRKRKPSTDRSCSESSSKTTPTTSVPSTPQHTRQHATANSSFSDKKHSISEVPEIVRTDSESLDSEILSSGVTEAHKGQEKPLESVIQLQNEFLFSLKGGYKYLNVNVWGTRQNDSDILLGYANIPLAHVLYECCSSMLGHYIKSYSFLPPNNAIPNSQSHPLLTHSGFEHVFCYGDILLSFVWNHEGPLEVKQKHSIASSEEISLKQPSSFMTKHDFVRTQFQRTTHCDFCTKKIWLKDAVQCRGCALCCHKKCIAKCQMNTECVPGDKAGFATDGVELLQPEIVTSETVDECGDAAQNGLKRVNSVNNLTIPGASVSSGQSRSLPPSPQRTPSRKQSISASNPFLLCPEALDDVCTKPSEASDTVCRLLDHIMHCPADETLMDAAKESAKQLYANMSHEEKVEKINTMVTELKKALDAITLEHMELSKQMSTEELEVEKARIAFLMGQADAKVHGLSVLMLHYCSGLQQTQDKIV